jgi:hypothetical protein
MKITEIFASIIPSVHWSQQGSMHLGVFEVHGEHYVMQFIKMKPNDPIHSVLSNEIITNNTWFFAFAAMVDGQPVDTDTNKGDAIPIFSAIMQTLVQFIEKYDIDVLYIGCSDKHTKLKGVYQRLISKYTRMHGWTVNNTATGNFFGDEKFIWILKK